MKWNLCSALVITALLANYSPSFASHARVISGIEAAEHYNGKSGKPIYIQAGSFTRIANAKNYASLVKSKTHYPVNMAQKHGYYVVTIGPVHNASETRKLATNILTSSKDTPVRLRNKLLASAHHSQIQTSKPRQMANKTRDVNHSVKAIDPMKSIQAQQRTRTMLADASDTIAATTSATTAATATMPTTSLTTSTTITTIQSNSVHGAKHAKPGKPVNLVKPAPPITPVQAAPAAVAAPAEVAQPQQPETKSTQITPEIEIAPDMNGTTNVTISSPASTTVTNPVAPQPANVAKSIVKSKPALKTKATTIKTATPAKKIAPIKAITPVKKSTPAMPVAAPTKPVTPSETMPATIETHTTHVTSKHASHTKHITPSKHVAVENEPAPEVNTQESRAFSQATWLVAVGAGAEFPSFNSSITVNNGSGAPAPFNQDIFTTKQNTKAIIAVSAGRRWTRDDSWIPSLSASLSYQHLFTTNPGGTITQYSTPAFKNYTYNWDVSTDLFLAIFKMNVFQYAKVSPYFAAGLGGAYNRSSNYNETALAGVIPRVSPGFASNSTMQFAYSLGAGLDFQVRDNVVLSADYQYLNLGNVSLGHGQGSWSGQSLNLGSYHANTALLSVAYLFGN